MNISAILGSLPKLGGIFDRSSHDNREINVEGKETSEAQTRHVEPGPLPTGGNYQLSYVYHQHPDHHTRPYFITSASGAPFPSFSTNPSIDFPARYTDVRNVRAPVENLNAPRIRVAPQELKYRGIDIDRVRKLAQNERSKPIISQVNLQSQSLGDPYQFPAFITFMALHENVVVLNLNDNELEDVSMLSLPCCRKLHLSMNNLTSFELLPPCLPNCEALYLQSNYITSFEHFGLKRCPKLQHITLKNNPIVLHRRYPHKLYKAMELEKPAKGFASACCGDDDDHGDEEEEIDTCVLRSVDGLPRYAPEQKVLAPDGSYVLRSQWNRRMKQRQEEFEAIQNEED